MKIHILSACFGLALAAVAAAVEPAPPTVASLDRDIAELSNRLRDSADRIADLQKRLETVEQRLGESYRGSSPFDTVERRLDDLEKDVDGLKRR
jgi:hypothetical protein